MKTSGFGFTISKDEKMLWWDDDSPITDFKERKGISLMCYLRWGHFYRPIPYFWKKEYWEKRGDDHPNKQEWNAWEGKHWKMIRLPFFIFPFISFTWNEFGAYVGVKVFGLHGGPDYSKWIRPEEDQEGNEALTISITFRKTRR